ncbi:MAG: hypothetical protein ACRDGA_13330 [Bacteroidota bacterium]
MTLPNIDPVPFRNLRKDDPRFDENLSRLIYHIEKHGPHSSGGGIPPIPNFQPNRWYAPPSIPGVGNSGGTLPTTGAPVTLSYIWIPNEVTFDRISVRVTDVSFSGSASADARIGVWNSDSENLPFELVIDSGIINISTTGFKQATINETLIAGLYHIGVLRSGNGTTNVSMRAIQPLPFGLGANSDTNADLNTIGLGTTANSGINSGFAMADNQLPSSPPASPFPHKNGVPTFRDLTVTLSASIHVGLRVAP